MLHQRGEVLPNLSLNTVLLPCCRLPFVFICILDVCHHPGPWYIASCSHFSLQKARMTRQHRLLWRSDTEGCVGGLWLKYDTVLRCLRCVIRLVITRHCNPMPGTQDLGGAMTLLKVFFCNSPLFKVFHVTVTKTSLSFHFHWNLNSRERAEGLVGLSSLLLGLSTNFVYHTLTTHVNI